MASLLRSNLLVRQICRNSISSKPRPSVQNKLKIKVANGLHTRVIYNKECILGKKFQDVSFRSRHIQQAVPVVAEQNSRRRQPFKSMGITHANDLDKAMFKLDVDVRRTGRLMKEDVQNVVQQIKSLGKATSMQGLLIIRCCGSLLAEETVSSRIELSDGVWKTLEHIGCPLDVSHYNALLKVYIDNEQQFSPIDFLAKMDQSGISPNRVTYQRLIGAYCQKGDLDGAGKILEFMKEKEIAVNEFVFNELIFGHAKANDIKGAKDMLDVMKNAKLEPSSNSYFQLARGYALHGNVEEIIKTIDEAQRNDILLTDRDILSLVSTLAVNGHANKVDEILQRAKQNTGYNQECVNVILNLINHGLDETSFQILRTMPRTTSMKDGSLAPAGSFLIKQMIKAERPAELIVKYCNEMEELKLNDQALLKATEFALGLKKPNHALLFLNEMAAKGYEIRNHYFWPVLIQKAEQGEQAVYDVLKTMCELLCMPNYDTYLEYALPRVNTLDPKIVVSKLKEFGQTVGAIVNPLMAFYLSQNDTVKAAILVEEYPVKLDPILTTRRLAMSFRGLQDIEPILKILVHLKDNADVLVNKALEGNCYDLFLFECARLRSFDEKNVAAILDAMKEKNLEISFAPNQSTSEAIFMLKNIASNTKKFPDQGDFIGSVPHPSDMNVEELENHLLELKSKRMNTRGVLRRLLLLHCRFRNVDRALEIKEELDRDNFQYSPGMYSQIMDLLVYGDKLEEALKIKNLAEQGDPNFALDDFKILNLAALLVKEERADEAIDIITKHYEKFGGGKKNDDFLSRNVYRLLSSAADKGDIELTNKLFDLAVVRCGYAKPTNVILGAKIKACFNNNDVPAALKEFEFCVSNYKCTPWKNEIFKKLILAEDTDNLQKVVDLCNEIYGEAIILYELALAFIDLDRIKQAKKILETPGLKALNLHLNRICDNLIMREKIKELEQFVLITRDLFDIDRDRMYYNLLRGYAKENNVKKAIGVWTSMQEEFLQPSSTTLAFLAEFLKKNNEPVPFEVPQLSSTAYSTIYDQLNTKSTRQDSQERKVHETSQKIQIFLSQDKRREATQLTENLLLQGLRPNMNTLKQLVIYLGEKGDVDSLNKIRDSLSDGDTRNLLLDNMICNAYINSGQHEFLMEKLENDKDYASNFPKGGYLAILDKCPTLEPRLVKIAERLYKENSLVGPKNQIWQYYFANENFEKADQIMKSCPEMKNKLLFRFVIQKIQRTKSVPLAQKLVSVVSNTENTPRTKGYVYSNLIELLVENNDTNTALETYKEAREKHSLLDTDFTAKVLVLLGQNIPEMQNSRQNQQPKKSSSSSSDSDSSDDEKTK